MVHEYQIQDLVDRCEEVTLTEKHSIKNLRLAETWGLCKLQQACLDGVGKFWTREEILEDPDLKKLSSGLQLDVMSRKVELFEAQLGSFRVEKIGDGRYTQTFDLKSLYMHLYDNGTAEIVIRKHSNYRM